MSELGFGIVGCGGAAFNVARALDSIDGVRVAATHDLNADMAADLAAARGAVVHASVQDLVSDPAVDVIYVALPHNLLAPAGLAALAAGKHVLVEKPMGVNLAQILALDELAMARNLRLGVFFELRETPAVQVAKRLVEGGAIGDIRAVRIQTIIDKPQSYWLSGPSGRTVDSWRSSAERAGGGVVLMNSIHQLDCVRFVTGLNVTTVAGEVATLIASVEVEDSASATLRFDNGAIGNLVAGAHSPGAHLQERIELDGTDGRIDLPDLYGTGDVRMFLKRGWQGHTADEWIEVSASPQDSFRAALVGYVGAVRTGASAPVGAVDAIAAMRTVLGLYESTRTGRSIKL
jgi:predicted dehydrogenase